MINCLSILPCNVLKTTKVYHNQGTSTNPATNPVTQVKPMIVARRTYSIKFVFGLKHPDVVIIFIVEFLRVKYIILALHMNRKIFAPITPPKGTAKYTNRALLLPNQQIPFSPNIGRYSSGTDSFKCSITTVAVTRVKGATQPNIVYRANFFHCPPMALELSMGCNCLVANFNVL